MPFRAAKISFDGSHYVPTPKENFPQGHKRRRLTHPLSEQETEQKEQFEAAYKESQQLPKKERKAYMRKAMEEEVRLVGLSALMTTTVGSMEETIRQLKEARPDCRVMVGGAVLNQEYADMIGADFYGKDAMQSVRYAQKLFGEVK